MVLTRFPSMEELGNHGLGGGDFQLRVPPAQGFCKAMLWGIFGCTGVSKHFQNKTRQVILTGSPSSVGKVIIFMCRGSKIRLLLFVFFSSLLILRERERERAWEGQRERERENPQQAPCRQCRA